MGYEERRNVDHPKLGYRCPADLKAALSERAKDAGLLPSTVVCALIHGYVTGAINVAVDAQVADDN